MTFLALCVHSAWAVEVPITASFRIDPTGGANQSFKNTTPTSGFCTKWPDRCTNNFFSVATGLTINKIWRATNDPGDALRISIPGEFREVDVSNGTATHRLKFRINAHSLYVERLPGGHGLAFAHFKAGTFSSPGGPCRRGGVSAGNSEYLLNLWVVRAQPSVCHSTFIYEGPYEVHYIPSLGYELVAPDPLRMHAGIYRGEIRYTVGPGQDFDYHNTAEYSSNEIVFKFELDVQHQLKMDFPGGADGRPVMATLEPDGGWQAWQGGRMPPRVRQDVPFRLSMSGPVSVHMLCGQNLGARCAIASGDDAIPLDVAISVPGAMSERTGAALSHTPLPIGAEAAEPIAATGGNIQFAYSTIHIQSPGPFKPATTYEGQITVVFDAET
ncbi:hypothetical protein [Pinirhizobacter soli]|uniref:hypothetical protein n=1 Tax=Pinirhizobacter soli TaxID=2786953 RepID=UPI00202ABBE9|nr:hypothetical protein [Pinirhizobacter soli]